MLTDRTELTRDLAAVINKHSVENASDTPDFILADYLVECLDNFAFVISARKQWYAGAKEMSTEIDFS